SAQDQKIAKLFDVMGDRRISRQGVEVGAALYIDPLWHVTLLNSHHVTAKLIHAPLITVFYMVRTASRAADVCPRYRARRPSIKFRPRSTNQDPSAIQLARRSQSDQFIG